ncbi:hypothetical protein JCM8097_005548 [Rhodosporidiobolus ruineniae]
MSLSPLFPYDVLRLIAEEAAGPADTAAERDAAKAISLVCRTLCDVDQRLLWRTLTFPPRWMETSADSPEKTRLMAMVRRLRWRTERSDGADDHPEALQAFLGHLGTTSSLQSVVLEDMSAPNIPAAFSAIASSPSLPHLTHFGLSGTLPWPKLGLDEPSEPFLVHFLSSLPALSSLELDPARLDPPPACTPLLEGTLRLKSIRLDTAHRYHWHLSDFLFPSIPRHFFASSLDRTTLVTVSVAGDADGPAWITWLSRPGFSSLRNMTIHHHGNTVSDLFPFLSSCFRHHPHLAAFILLDVSPGYDIGLMYNAPILVRFLRSFPPSVNFIDLAFPCPLDAVRAFLASPELAYLHRFRCLDNRSRFALTWEWNEDRSRFDEVSGATSSPFLPFST